MRCTCKKTKLAAALPFALLCHSGRIVQEAACPSAAPSLHRPASQSKAHSCSHQACPAQQSPEHAHSVPDDVQPMPETSAPALLLQPDQSRFNSIHAVACAAEQDDDPDQSALQRRPSLQSEEPFVLGVDDASPDDPMCVSQSEDLAAERRSAAHEGARVATVVPAPRPQSPCRSCATEAHTEKLGVDTCSARMGASAQPACDQPAAEAIAARFVVESKQTGPPPWKPAGVHKAAEPGAVHARQPSPSKRKRAELRRHLAPDSVASPESATQQPSKRSLSASRQQQDDQGIGAGTEAGLGRGERMFWDMDEPEPRLRPCFVPIQAHTRAAVAKRFDSLAQDKRETALEQAHLGALQGEAAHGNCATKATDGRREPDSSDAAKRVLQELAAEVKEQAVRAQSMCMATAEAAHQVSRPMLRCSTLFGWCVV
jgi:hypothetical protein